ncbi:hypothetical protein AN286_05645 [Aliarcobacter cryaerophilus ATCC 43158]|uniref:BvgS-like domain-containing two-component system sensor histidine kinase n=1 Tax=Aliarcobacter cryaerophilus ATCC 43158 TaxID=1032070 RepID=A0AAD0TSP4_9BACT|nr:transporter substrate-binding domain-containing protein [Aliarcobacter cryaerophilus]AYJ79653.1 BvgS-like domain-containing two-component system sensor histidine kinase [Aliarcobacter cryaerophilus ATCC 43158]PRM98676.1 histidine kinase [Aliarcobacter cryaerophilus]QCZ23895.1 hypothetical protein AN286_05645 [Aliarcobacter cryaerophilus ATCC 43158]
MKRVLFLLIFVLLGSIFSNEIELEEEEKEYLNNKKIIKMCVDPDWFPFEIINQDNVHEGISADLIKIIKDKLNLNIELIPTKNWDESIEFSKNKKCDILSFLNETPKRKEWLVFTKPIFTDQNVLIGRAERKYIEDISKENLSIALPRQTAMSERFANDFPNLIIIPTSTEDEAFKLVEEYKADLTLRSLIITAYTIKKNGLFNLKIVGEPKDYENYLRIGVRNDEPILKDILNKAIVKITKKDVDNIVNKYVTVVVNKTTTLTTAFWVLGIFIIIILIILLWNYLLNKKVKIELKKNEEQQLKLIEQKRKAQIGELLGNISHQWRNGLAQISSLNLEMILMYQLNKNLQQNSEFYQRLKDTENSIKFMVETMNTFLGYYKEEKNHKEFEIKENIEDVLKLIDIEIKNSNLNIKIIKKFNLKITANNNEWMHIWLNLITNTIKASKNQNITPKIKITINENSIIYTDNCKGLEEKTIKEIKNNKQEGLGLKMTKKILEKNSWFFSIENIDNGLKIIFYKK